jgi:D-alanyl-D-alanine carboxypeptidase
MRTKVAVAACGVLLLAAASAPAGEAKPAPKAHAHAQRAAYAAKLRTQIPAVMKANAIPGTVVLIRSPKQGNWSATFGTAQIGKRVPMRITDAFRIGSNTKTMTSTVILQLVQEGKIKLDDPISKYRPDVPNGDNITIAQLAEMRSGLYSYTFDPGFNATLDREPQKAWTPDELLAIAFAHPPTAAPGTEFEYSNTNIVLLGLVIEKVTGMSATQAFQKRIFGPLKMTHSLLPLPAQSTIPGRHAQGYQFGTNVATIDSYAVPAAQLPAALNGSLLPIDETKANPSWAWTAGGAISTPRELARYVKAMVGGGLLNAKTQKVRMDSIQPTDPDSPNGVGYGIGIAQFAPGILGHDGQLPGYSSFMAYNRNTHDTIIIAANLSASPVNGENAAVVLAKTIIGTLYGAGDVPVDPPASATAER